MRGLRLGLGLVVVASLGLACTPTEMNPLAVDDDGDGYSEFDGDCDDDDAYSTVIASDADCDGVLTADDCDDEDAYSTVIATDADCDAVLTADDCDDDDPSTVDDMDCDGVLTADDCDDEDPGSSLCAWVPILTSNSSASPILVSASSVNNDNPSLDAWRAFDGSSATSSDIWHSHSRDTNTSSDPESLSVDFGSGTTRMVSHFTLTSRNQNRCRFAPTTFQLLGSNDDNNWTTLFSVSNDTLLMNQVDTATYYPTLLGDYRYYTLNVDVAHLNAPCDSSLHVVVSDMQLYFGTL